MSRKKRQGPSHERWLVSYADFVTMIFSVFVVLFASAQADRQRQAEMATAIRAAFSRLEIFPGDPKNSALVPGRIAPATNAILSPDEVADEFTGTPAERANLLAIEKNLEAVLASEILQQTVALRLTRDGLVVSLMEVGFFDSGSAALKPASLPTVQKIVSQLKAVPNDLRVEGHTDDLPIHSALFASNWELSTARATTVAKLLIEAYGYNPAKLSAAGYAQYRPAAPNTDAAGRARNRRVDLVILPIAVPARDWTTQAASSPRH